MIEQGHPEEEVEKMRGGMEEEEGWVENSLLPPRCTLLILVNNSMVDVEYVSDILIYVR